MNSLEFINQEIEYLNNKIKYLKEEPYTSFVRNYINYCEEKVEYLQQIKTELEAWEVVKKEIKINYNKNTYMTIAITYCDFIENEKYDKIKKALEVKDETK